MLTLYIASAAFVLTPLPPTCDTPPRVRLVRAASDPEATRDDSRDADAPMMEAFKRFRERQHQQTSGAPMKEWAESADPKNWREPPEGAVEKPEGQDGYTPPTEEQTKAVFQDNAV